MRLLGVDFVWLGKWWKWYGRTSTRACVRLPLPLHTSWDVYREEVDIGRRYGFDKMMEVLGETCGSE